MVAGVIGAEIVPPIETVVAPIEVINWGALTPPTVRVTKSTFSTTIL